MSNIINSILHLSWSTLAMIGVLSMFFIIGGVEKIEKAIKKRKLKK